ncbi:hypothetical protein LENED_012483 [Lentinula edodes]|uniref:Uncharacterized protein n=1 Tax=Lentinula edodes TaxID=5353 RepID=A0A1Q3ESN8_LENED|nr:hypothetical protein LENED_012483 [Lentinula edodes]
MARVLDILQHSIIFPKVPTTVSTRETFDLSVLKHSRWISTVYSDESYRKHENVRICGIPVEETPGILWRNFFQEASKSSKRSESCGNESETIVRSASHNYLCR